MYAKIFRQIYDGTLAADWHSLIVFQQLLILADYHGSIDMTHEAINRITGIPLTIIKEGIEKLEQPDTQSRSKEADGCRIKRIDPHRNWGWDIVNFKKYRDIRDEEGRREYMREYMREYREKPVNTQSLQKFTEVKSKQCKQVLAHTDTDTDTDTDNTNILSVKGKKPPSTDPAVKEFIDYAYQTFLSIKKEKLHIDGGKDGKTIKSLLGTYGLEKLKALWDKFLASQDDFILKAGFSIGVFKSQINKLTSGEEKPKTWRDLKYD